MLAAVTYLMKGTPFIFQGEEIGMTNVTYERIDQFHDIETLGQYQDRIAAGETEADFIAAANDNGRDNARTPMQWDASEMSGFSQSQPWIDVNPNYPEINVINDRARPDGIFQFYQGLIALRRNSATIQDGAYIPLEENNPKVFAYIRQLNDERIYVCANFTAEALSMETPVGLNNTAQTLMADTSTPVKISDHIEFAAYQVMVFRISWEDV